MTTQLRDELMKWFFDNYITEFFQTEEVVLDGKLRNEFIEKAKAYKTNSLHKYICDSILEGVKKEIMLKTHNDIEIAYQRGIARGVQLYNDRLISLSTLTKLNEADNKTN